ncbi:LysR family transcriptional regulator [Parahaliea mediterranea]|uniref:LysR family transcriptional regulator n=1 Tax=Parahaliea mediterranea TaxID=651086 RepID=A0A939ILX2_9GAMM|nr:LysR family transcriptional regulator [Parahaliea mediterranea]MBN7796412.1 LysR family transcriptional regulator [Parahaliea mediterranea]
MDLRKLDIFATVARLGSFSQAAQQLHMAQPAVSIAVRKLEEELGLALFDRSGRRVRLTAEGRELCQRAEAILGQVAELERQFGERRGLMRGELTVSCPSMVATYYLPEFLGEFLGEHPGLTASVSQLGTTHVRRQLLEGELELGVISEDGAADELAQLERVPLLEQPILLCMAEHHPWAGRARIDIEELHGSPMVVYESGYFIRDQLDRLCRARDVSPELRMQSNFLPLLVRMVKQGLGTTIGLEIMAAGEPGIVAVPLAGDARLRMSLAKRRGRAISRANQAFLDWAAFKL